MECSVISSEGQIALPPEVLSRLGLEIGDKVYFIRRNGSVVIKPTTYDPLNALQDLMEGEAERVGLNTEEDVVNFCKEIRMEMISERNQINANNA